MARNKKKHTHKREIHTQDRQLFMDLLQVSMIKMIQIRKKILESMVWERCHKSTEESYGNKIKLRYIPKYAPEPERRKF